MCHAERVLLHDWLTGHGGTVDAAATIRRKVIASRGEHEAEDAIADAVGRGRPGGAGAAPAEAVDAQTRQDARLTFELAGALDAAGEEREARPLRTTRPSRCGLREPHRHRALIQKASSLRHLGGADEACTLLDDLADERPGSAAVVAFRALVRCDARSRPRGGRRPRRTPWCTTRATRTRWPTPAAPCTPTPRTCATADGSRLQAAAGGTALGRGEVRPERPAAQAGGRYRSTRQLGVLDAVATSAVPGAQLGPSGCSGVRRGRSTWRRGDRAATLRTTGGPQASHGLGRLDVLVSAGPSLVPGDLGLVLQLRRVEVGVATTGPPCGRRPAHCW